MLVVYYTPLLNTFQDLGSLWTRGGQRFQLVLFLLFGLTFAALHHLFGIYLSGKPASHDSSSRYLPISYQTAVSILGNALTQIVKWLLASTIAVAYAQYFWSATKSYQEDLDKLDAPLAAANGNPFTFSAFPTWWRSTKLAFYALMMMSMILIPIAVPGSIRVVTATGLTQPCTVSVPNVSMAYLATARTTVTGGGGPGLQVRQLTDDGPSHYSGPASGRHIAGGKEFRDAYKATTYTTALVNRVIVGGSYLPVPNPCGFCTYKVSFIAPSLMCSSNITRTYDFATNLPPSYKTDTWLPILNGTRSDGYALTVATRDGVIGQMNQPVAVSCNASIANYHVSVQHDNLSSYIHILDITFDSSASPSQTDPLNLALGGLILALGDAFNGSIVFDSQYDGFAETPLSIGYSPMLRWVHTDKNASRLTWPDLTTSLPELMQNISISLLSGQFPSIKQTYMEKVQTQCSMTQLVYEYDSRRLLGIYAAACGVAATFVLLGLVTVQKNGEEHTLDFSHVVGQLRLQPSSKL